MLEFIIVDAVIICLTNCSCSYLFTYWMRFKYFEKYKIYIKKPFIMR